MFLNKTDFFFNSGLYYGGSTILDKRLNYYNLNFFIGRRKFNFIVNFRKFLYLFRIFLFFIYRLLTLRGKVLGFDDRFDIRRCLIFFFTRANQSYVTKNWIGGTLTNFRSFKRFFFQICKGLRSLKQYYHIFIYFYGLKNTIRLPSLIILSNPNPNSLGSLQESFRIGIPTLSIINVNSFNNYGLTFCLPTNGNDFESVFLFYNIIGDSLLFGWIKPVVKFFNKFIERLKKFRKMNYIMSLNQNYINNFYTLFLKDNFQIKNYFLKNKDFFLFFFKKFKIITNLNFVFLKKNSLSKKFKKRFFKKSFIFLWFLKRIKKYKKIKKRKKKSIKKIFKYKIKIKYNLEKRRYKKKKKYIYKYKQHKYKQHKYKQHKYKQHKYKVLNFFKTYIIFRLRKLLTKNARRSRYRSKKIIYFSKFFIYRKFYKKFNLQFILKRFYTEQEYIEEILEEFDELPEERKEKALRKLTDSSKKMDSTFLNIEKVDNLELKLTKKNFIYEFNKDIPLYIKGIEKESNIFHKFSTKKIAEKRKKLKFYNLIFFKDKKFSKNFNFLFMKLKFKYKKILQKRRSSKYNSNDFFVKSLKKKTKTGFFELSSNLNTKFFLLKKFIYFF